MKISLTKFVLGATLFSVALIGCADQATEDGRKFREYMCAYELANDIAINAEIGRKPSSSGQAAKVKEWLNTHPYGMLQARYLMGQASSQETERFQKSFNETKCPTFD